MTDALTTPEHACDRKQKKVVVAEVCRRGGCGCCVNRDRSKDAWDRGYCTDPHRTFPLCVNMRTGPQFALDESTLEKAA